MTGQQRRQPRDAEDAAAFKGVGQGITVIRERCGMGREELAKRRHAAVTSVVTEEYERRLWDDLNSLLVDAVPDGTSEAQAEDAILLAVMGPRLRDSRPLQSAASSNGSPVVCHLCLG